MRIKRIDHDITLQSHRVSSTVIGDDGVEHFIVLDISPPESVSEAGCVDGFALFALLLAMQAGEDLIIDPPVSEILSASLQDIAMIYGYVRGISPPSRIHVKEMRPAALQTNSGALLGFSGGIDSFYALWRHRLSERPIWPHVSQLFHFELNNLPDKAQEIRVDSTGRKIARSISSEIGLPLITIDSNLDAVLPAPATLIHTIRNTGVAHCISRVAGNFLYSSAVDYRDCAVSPVPHHGLSDLCIVDPVLLPLLSTDRLLCRSQGSGASRMEKTSELTKCELAKRSLFTCVKKEHTGSRLNCSECFKCVRTQFSLDVIGKLEDFDEVFDISLFRSKRGRYAADALSLSTPFYRDIQQEALSNGVDLRLWAGRDLWRPRVIARRLPSALRKPLRRLMGIPG